MIQETKTIRSILGPVKLKESEHRRRANQEILEAMEIDNVVHKILGSQMVGHVYRASDDFSIKAIAEWVPGRRSSRGSRPT